MVNETYHSGCWWCGFAKNQAQKLFGVSCGGLVNPVKHLNIFGGCYIIHSFDVGSLIGL